jgi:hypothetical protein
MKEFIRAHGRSVVQVYINKLKRNSLHQFKDLGSMQQQLVRILCSQTCGAIEFLFYDGCWIEFLFYDGCWDAAGSKSEPEPHRIFRVAPAYNLPPYDPSEDEPSILTMPEIIKKYGSSTVQSMVETLKGLTVLTYHELPRMGKEIIEALRKQGGCVEFCDPKADHKQWLSACTEAYPVRDFVYRIKANYQLPVEPKESTMTVTTVDAILQACINLHGRAATQTVMKQLQCGPDFIPVAYGEHDGLHRQLIAKLCLAGGCEVFYNALAEWRAAETYVSPIPSMVYRIKSDITMPPVEQPKVQRKWHMHTHADGGVSLHCTTGLSEFSEWQVLGVNADGKIHRGSSITIDNVTPSLQLDPSGRVEVK